ncbi:hypothetical protein [Sinomonas atrocyanea]|jgi:hypothetical protein|uniref:hypothetical protein n=1 Tax=Sinomonas atrocyanea TaxID=37927 RepID=UPI002786527F|nr:hypothetical protein [Sinomonas atrocyanea]MDQ0261067.1 hypothetical protein [Sinomonas atrocyanea]MDR6620392.1 hypothetical protein [Sinomonas atrocyanea]
MLKKAIAVLAVAFAALVAAPSAANAAYVVSNNITVAGDATPGGTVTVNFAAGSFAPNEEVSASVTGNTAVTLSVVKAAVTTQFTKQASATGAVSFNVTLPADASGTYTLTAKGLTSGNVGTATITVVPASVANTGTSASMGNAGGAALAETGASLPMLMVWIGAGALVLGVAIVATLGFVRKQRRA